MSTVSCSSVGWSAYTKDTTSLMKGIHGSSWVISCRDNGILVGLARVLSDDASIMYLQDVLVNPSHQKKGIGARLVQLCLERFAHTRQKVLLTDDSPEQHRFYRSLGFSNTRDIEKYVLNTYVRIEEVDLE